MLDVTCYLLLMYSTVLLNALTLYRTVKNFHKFRGFVAIHKVISTKFEGTGPLARQK